MGGIVKKLWKVFRKYWKATGRFLRKARDAIVDFMLPGYPVPIPVVRYEPRRPVREYVHGSMSSITGLTRLRRDFPSDEEDEGDYDDQMSNDIYD